MAEMETEAKIVIVNMTCDKCNNGLMEFNNETKFLVSNFGKEETYKFIHKCNKCGHKEDYDVKYPYQKLIPIK